MTCRNGAGWRRFYVLGIPQWKNGRPPAGGKECAQQAAIPKMASRRKAGGHKRIYYCARVLVLYFALFFRNSARKPTAAITPATTAMG